MYICPYLIVDTFSSICLFINSFFIIYWTRCQLSSMGIYGNTVLTNLYLYTTQLALDIGILDSWHLWNRYHVYPLFFERINGGNIVDKCWNQYICSANIHNNDNCLFYGLLDLLEIVYYSCVSQIICDHENWLLLTLYEFKNC